jgi:type II secretory pathway pseudopilin PulG
MKKRLQKKKRRVIIITAIFAMAIIAVIIYLIVTLQLQNIKRQSFVESFESLVSKAHMLTQSYQREVGKWQAKQYDNKTMISITNDYLPKYKGLLNESKALNPFPPGRQYQNAVELYTKSIELELQSNIDFRNYLSTGNLAENETSSRLLSDALRYETDSFAAFKSAR